MSKISADTLRAMTDGVETPMKYPVQGSAKAFAIFNGTGTVATINSLNLSSLVDGGTGIYTTNLSSAYSTTGYSFAGAVRGNGSANGYLGSGSASSKTVSAMEIYSLSAATTLYDSPEVNVVSFGTLA